jgi:hypothetical protein
MSPAVSSNQSNNNNNNNSLTPRKQQQTNQQPQMQPISSATFDSQIPDERTMSPYPYKSLSDASSIDPTVLNHLKFGCVVFNYTHLTGGSVAVEYQPVASSSASNVVSKLFSFNNSNNNAAASSSSTAKVSDAPTWSKQYFWTDGRSIFFAKNLESAKRPVSAQNARLMVLPAQAITNVAIIAPATMKQETNAPSNIEKSGLCITYSTALLYSAFYRGKNANLTSNGLRAKTGDAKLTLALEDHVKRASWITAIDNVLKEIQAEREVVDQKHAQQCQIFCDQETAARRKNILDFESSESKEIFSEQRDEFNFILKVEAATNKKKTSQNSNNNRMNNNAPKSGSLIVPSSRMNAVTAACRQAAFQPLPHPKPDAFSLCDEDGFVLSKTGDVTEMQAVCSSSILSVAQKFHKIISKKSTKQLLEERRKKRILAKIQQIRRNTLNNNNNQDNDNEEKDEEEEEADAADNQTAAEVAAAMNSSFEVTSITVETNLGGAYFIQKTAPGLVMLRKFNNVSTTGALLNESFAMVNDNMSMTSAGAISYYDISAGRDRGQASSRSATGNNNNNNNTAAAATTMTTTGNTNNKWIKWNLGGK